MKNAITGSKPDLHNSSPAGHGSHALGGVDATWKRAGRGADANDSSRSVPCSAAAAAGDWAYTETGAVFPAGVAVPFAAVARYTLEADGDLSGTATSSSGGTLANVTLKGTFTVIPDCTGTLTAGVYASGNLVRTASFDVVYVDGARGARGIVTSLVLVNGTVVPSVLTIDAEKVFKGPLHER
jgi:hypothetical protein